MISCKNVGNSIIKRISELKAGDTFLYGGNPYFVVLRNGHKIYVCLGSGNFAVDNLGSEHEKVVMIECELRYKGAVENE